MTAQDCLPALLGALQEQLPARLCFCCPVLLLLLCLLGGMGGFIPRHLEPVLTAIHCVMNRHGEG